MKKNISILMLALLLASGISAQEEKPVFRQKGDLTLNVNGAMGILDLYAMSARNAPYYNLSKPSVNTELNGELDLLVYGQMGLLEPLGLILEFRNYYPGHLGLGTMLDYRLNRTLSVGLGVESYCSNGNWCHYMKANDRNAWLLPVYGNLRVRFGGKRVVPFGEVQLGYAFPLNTVTLLPDWDGQITRATEPVWHGQLQAKGIYTGIDLGIEFGHHEITMGSKCVPMSGDLTHIHTGETSHRSSNMVNIYVKYAYRIRVR